MTFHTLSPITRGPDPSNYVYLNSLPRIIIGSSLWGTYIEDSLAQQPPPPETTSTPPDLQLQRFSSRNPPSSTEYTLLDESVLFCIDSITYPTSLLLLFYIFDWTDSRYRDTFLAGQNKHHQVCTTTPELPHCIHRHGWSFPFLLLFDVEHDTRIPHGHSRFPSCVVRGRAQGVTNPFNIWAFPNSTKSLDMKTKEEEY